MSKFGYAAACQYSLPCCDISRQRGAWLGGANTGLIRKLSPTLQVLTTYSLPFDFTYMTFDGVNVWGASKSSLAAAELSTSNGAILNTYPPGGQAGNNLRRP